MSPGNVHVLCAQKLRSMSLPDFPSLFPRSPGGVSRLHQHSTPRCEVPDPQSAFGGCAPLGDAEAENDPPGRKLFHRCLHSAPGTGDGKGPGSLAGGESRRGRGEHRPIRATETAFPYHAGGVHGGIFTTAPPKNDNAVINIRTPWRAVNNKTGTRMSMRRTASVLGGTTPSTPSTRALRPLSERIQSGTREGC